MIICHATVLLPERKSGNNLNIYDRRVNVFTFLQFRGNLQDALEFSKLLILHVREVYMK